MRQQFAPLILCLFISLLCVFQESEASINMIKYNYENSLIKGISDNFIEENSASVLANSTAEKSVFTSQKSDEFLTDSKRSFATDNRLLSEFSYNFLNPALVNYSPISKKILKSSYQYSENPQSIFYQGIFYGFVLMVLLMNVVCYFIFEEKLFLYFFGAIFALTSVLFYGDGLLSLLNANIQVDSKLFEASLLFISISIAALFAHRFLNVKDFYPKAKILSFSLLGVAFVVLASAWITKSSLLASISNTALFIVLSSYFIIGTMLFSKKSYARFFVIAFSVPLLFAIDYFVLQGFGATLLFTGTTHLKVAILIEAMLLSYGIIYRMNAIKDEVELRQTEMRIFIKKQEMMNRENITNLMKDVYLENLIMQHDLDGLEIKLLQYISEGVENSKIARKLKMSETNVEELTNELYEKLEIREQVKSDYRMVETQPDYIYN